MNLQHDEVVKKLDIAAVLIVSVITIFELIVSHGIYCKAPYATFLLATRVGTRLDQQEPFKTSGSGISWNPILVTLAVIVYLISVLLKNKKNIKNCLLNTVLQILPKLCKRSSQIKLDPEQGKLQFTSSTAGARGALSIGLDRPLSSPIDSAGSPEVTMLSKIIQVAAYKPSTLQEVHSVCEEDESQTGRSSLRHEAMSCSEDEPAPLKTEESMYVVPSSKAERRVAQKGVTQPETSILSCETLTCHGDQPVHTNNLASVLHPSTEDHSIIAQPQVKESAQEISWKVSFIIVFFSFLIGFIFILADMKNGLAVGVFERLIIFAYYCLPFYWVILVEECYLVSKRIVRSWLSENFSIYID